MNLEDHVQAYADRAQRPIIVFDADFTVVAFSAHDPEVDQARLSIILSRKGSAIARDMIREHRVGQHEGPVFIPSVEGRPAREVTALRHDGYLVGYISTYALNEQAEPLSPETLGELDEIAGQIAGLVAMAALTLREGHAQAQELIAALFGPDEEDRAHAAQDLVAHGLVSPLPPYSVISIATRPGTDPRASTLRSALDRVLASVLGSPSLHAAGAVIDNEALVIAPHSIDPSRVEALLSKPEFAELRAGIGGPRDELTAAPASRREARLARRATQLRTAQGIVRAWDDLGLERLFLQLSVENLLLSDLPSSVQKLCDTSSGPDLGLTLEAYLDCGCDAQRAAQELHVHRSTLYYRLDRVRALTGVDLSDGRVRRELHTGLWLASLAGFR